MHRLTTLLTAVSLCMSCASEPRSLGRVQRGGATPRAIGGSGGPLECSSGRFIDSIVHGAGSGRGLGSQFMGPCVQHDYCYRHGAATYGHSRARCDEDLLAQINSLCPLVNLNQPFWQAWCRFRAGLTYLGVRVGGCFSYRDAAEGTYFEYDFGPVGLPGAVPTQIVAAHVSTEKGASVLRLKASRDDTIEIERLILSDGYWQPAETRSTGLSASLLRHPIETLTPSDDMGSLLLFNQVADNNFRVQAYRLDAGLVLSPTPVPASRLSPRYSLPPAVVAGEEPSIGYVTRAQEYRFPNGRVEASYIEVDLKALVDDSEFYRPLRVVANTAGTHVEKYKKFQFAPLWADFDGDGAPEPLFHFRKRCRSPGACKNDEHLFFWRVVRSCSSCIDAVEIEIDFPSEREPLFAAQIDGDPEFEIVSVCSGGETWCEEGEEGELVIGSLHLRSEHPLYSFEEIVSHRVSARRDRTERAEYLDRPYLVSDLDRDGRSDLLFLHCSIKAETARLNLLTLSPRADGTWDEAERGFTVPPAACSGRNRPLLADVDGDGREDLTLASESDLWTLRYAPGGWAEGWTSKRTRETGTFRHRSPGS